MSLEEIVANAHVILKSQHRDFLFHISRSCDKKVLVCCWNQQDEKVHCYSKMMGAEEKKFEMLSEDVENQFGFEKPINVAENTWQTNLRIIPHRDISILQTSKSVYSRIIIGRQLVKLIGVHIHMDFVPVGPPVVHKVVIVGYDLTKKTYVTETLGAEVYRTCVFKLFSYFFS